MKQLHVEASTYCNARCPLCPRSLYGYKVEGVYPEMHLTKDKLQVALDKFPELEYVYFNGHLGDPMMNPNIADLVELTNCRTDLTTNGSLGTQKSWERIAQHDVGVRFSIDGLEDTNHLYRQNVRWEFVERNMKAFIAAGGRARWDYLIFEHSECDVERAEQLAKEWGVERFMKKKTGRFIKSSDSSAKTSHQSVNRKGKETQKLAKPKKAEHQNLALVKQKEIETANTYNSKQTKTNTT